MNLLIPIFIISIGFISIQTNPYEKNVIQIVKTTRIGYNDQYDIDIFVKDYSIAKGKKVCEFYKDLYKPIAKNKFNKVTIYINLWSKKILKSQIDNTKIQDLYFRGGINYNDQSQL